MRTLIVSVALIALASVAHAATLSVAPDKSSYQIGETVTLTVTADDEGAAAYSVYGRLVYSGALVDNGPNNGTQFQTLLGPGWIKNVLNATDDGVNASIEAFGQISIEPRSADNLPGTLSTVTLIAQAIGVVDVEWDAQSLSFFDLPSAPGTSFTIVPEPSASELLGLGLAWLARHKRRKP